MQTIRLQKRENPLSVTADMNGLLSSNKTLAPQAGQSALGGDVLCIGDCSIAAVIFWNAIDRRSNIERRRFLAVELIACDHAQTFALRPPKPFGHRVHRKCYSSAQYACSGNTYQVQHRQAAGAAAPKGLKLPPRRASACIQHQEIHRHEQMICSLAKSECDAEHTGRRTRVLER
jgi:hypothetical protein